MSMLSLLQVRAEREDAGLREWDRFARAEYVRLAVEEDGDDSPGADAGGGRPWGGQGDAGM